LKQINALCKHLAKLGSGTVELPIPQFLPVAAQVQRVAPPSPRSSPVGRDTPREEKFEAQTPAKKRRDPPAATPNATPSPQAKDARQGMSPSRNNAQQHTTTKKAIIKNATTRNATTQHAAIQGKSRTNTENTITESTITQNKPIRRMSTNHAMREYDLQIAVKAVKGKIVVEEEVETQIRVIEDNKEFQLANVEDHECKLVLCKWDNLRVDEVDCNRCKAQLRREEAPNPTALCFWTCEEHDFGVCLSCLHVVLRTETYVYVKKQ
jgi:hypothetical protein